ncbi:MAG TPA: thiolase family protein [Acidimicrobiales bacterium]|nr:thiolase family protein [Acidimicrobiales bacterium]
MPAHIVGTGMTPFGFAPESTVRSLATAAVDEALTDAGVAVADVDMVVFANAGEGVLTGQEMIRGQVVFHRYGFGGIPIMNVENACASASTALQTACMAVASGTADVVVAVGAEKLTNADKRRTMAVFSAAVDFDDMPALRDQVQRDLLGIGKEPRVDVVDVVAGPVQSALMEVYAATTRRFFARGGGSAADAAAVAAKNRAHAAFNPQAQFREPRTVEQVLTSRMIADPLRLLMCSPVADGAAAVVVCSEERTRSLAAARPVRIDACTLRSGGSGDIESNGAVRRAAAAAYETAGAGPTDVDVAEVHDAAAPAELWTYEQLSLCEAGGAPALLADGSTRLGGRCPVNPSGGLLSRGHPVGATGLAQVVELVDQLRGRCGPRQVDGARLALAQNSGGHLSGEEAVAVVTILSAI